MRRRYVSVFKIDIIPSFPAIGTFYLLLLMAALEWKESVLALTINSVNAILSLSFALAVPDGEL